MKWAILVSVLVIIGGCIYWFGVRPSLAVKTCYKQAVERAEADCKNVNTGREHGGFDKCVLEVGQYSGCLKEWGVK